MGGAPPCSEIELKGVDGTMELDTQLTGYD